MIYISVNITTSSSSSVIIRCFQFKSTEEVIVVSFSDTVVVLSFSLIFRLVVDYDDDDFDYKEDNDKDNVLKHRNCDFQIVADVTNDQFAVVIVSYVVAAIAVFADLVVGIVDVSKRLPPIAFATDEKEPVQISSIEVVRLTTIMDQL